MPELIPGGDVTRGLLEAQLHKLGLRFNADYFLVQVGGQWVLSLSEDNYRRWVDSHGDPQDADDSGAQDGDEDAPHDPPAEGGDPDVADPESEGDEDGKTDSGDTTGTTKDNPAPQPKRANRKGR